MPRALITGITGQDGSYLAELLLAKGYEVHGVVRPGSRIEQSHIRALYGDRSIRDRRLMLHRCDLNDAGPLEDALRQAAPDEVYHLASQSHVGLSFKEPEATCQFTALSTVRLLELCRKSPSPPRVFHASSSEIFGHPKDVPQVEETCAAPVSPYGCAKAFATHIVAVYRGSYGLFASNGILYNHESPRRGEQFVTRKICRGAAAISLGLQHELFLGDLTPERDWGHARDYVRGMWLALQHSQPEDFIFATGQTHSVQEWVEAAFQAVHLDWRKHVRHDPALSRPAEPRRLVGNAEKAKRLLGWTAETGFEQLVEEMIQAELAALR